MTQRIDALLHSFTVVGSFCTIPSLIFKGIHDGFPPSENYARLERLAAKVINPYLGFFGFYEGSSKPTIESSLKPSRKIKHLGKIRRKSWKDSIYLHKLPIFYVESRIWCANFKNNSLQKKQRLMNSMSNQTVPKLQIHSSRKRCTTIIAIHTVTDTYSATSWSRWWRLTPWGATA